MNIELTEYQKIKILDLSDVYLVIFGARLVPFKKIKS